MTSMEFTGERYVPGLGGAQISYEHLHRYLFARRWAQGRTVLDAASGAGYGAALLAECGSRVSAVDLDGDAALHARRSYPRENLQFLRADALRLPFGSGTFEFVTAFEVLEHLGDPQALVCELARVCRSDGLVLVSTPDKALYSDARDYHNPFHVSEFYHDEFLALLHGSFRTVELFFQQVRAGSLISRTGGGGCELMTQPVPDSGDGPPAARYFLALCGNGPVLPLPEASVYLDLTDTLFEEWRKTLTDANGEIERLNLKVAELGQWGQALDRDLAERDETLRRTLDELGERDRTIRGLQEEMSREVSGRDLRIRELQRDFEERTLWAVALQRDVSERDERLRRTNDALESASAHLARIRHAFVYRVLCRLGILPG